MAEIREEFIVQIALLVKKYAPQYEIMVHSPIIAQAILEAWNYKTNSLSILASKYHNYHGLKCGSKWTGRSVNLSTNEEYQAGVMTSIRDNFRVFGSMDEGVKGYFEFIQLSRYKNLKGIAEPQRYLETIKADGYATDSKYVSKCMALIEQYDLTKYDAKEVEKVGKYASEIVKLAQSWIGKKEANGTHKEIIDIYNSHKPLARGYKVKYTDAWCATTISALAIKLGYTDIIPTECGCQQMIELFKKLGCWIENENRTPKAGEIIFYDWQDSGSGDNQGWSDHVGIVESVSNGKITVIEGNYSESVKRRTLAVNGKYIRGYGVPRYDAEEVKQESASSSTTGSEEYKMPTIRRGSKGKAVKIWQIIIGADADGDFGAETERLTRAFQEEHGLTVDAIVGQKSWKAGLATL